MVEDFWLFKYIIRIRIYQVRIAKLPLSMSQEATFERPLTAVCLNCNSGATSKLEFVFVTSSKSIAAFLLIDLDTICGVKKVFPFIPCLHREEEG